MLQAIREELVVLNQALPEKGLMAWTSGDVSIRGPETDLAVIKPSGVKFPDLTPESMLAGDLIKLVFLRVHGFAVRDRPRAALWGLILWPPSVAQTMRRR